MKTLALRDIFLNNEGMGIKNEGTKHTVYSFLLVQYKTTTTRLGKTSCFLKQVSLTHMNAPISFAIFRNFHNKKRDVTVCNIP